MKNGNYKLINGKNGSTLHIQLTDDDFCSIVQRNAKGEHTAQQCRSRNEGEIAIERAEKAGMKVEYSELTYCA